MFAFEFATLLFSRWSNDVQWLVDRDFEVITIERPFYRQQYRVSRGRGRYRALDCLFCAILNLVPWHVRGQTAKRARIKWGANLSFRGLLHKACSHEQHPNSRVFVEFPVLLLTISRAILLILRAGVHCEIKRQT